MTNYYVGQGGSDAADGLTWANRYLTLAEAETNLPTTGDHTIIIGPGVYREKVTGKVRSSGTVTYSGDPTGRRTDELGGEIRWTGSDNDSTVARNGCYETTSVGNCRGKIFEKIKFHLFSTSTQIAAITFYNSTCTPTFTVRDCVFDGVWNTGSNAIALWYLSSWPTITIERCLFLHCGDLGTAPLDFRSITTPKSLSISINNCLVLSDEAIFFEFIYGVTIKNCTLLCNTGFAVSVEDNGASNQSFLYNSLIEGRLAAQTSGELVADYINQPNLRDNLGNTNVTPGGNSQTYASLFMPMPLLAYNDGPGIQDKILYPAQYPYPLFAPSEWSAYINEPSANSPPSDDLFGIPRPTADAKKTWGAIQYTQLSRDITTVYGSESESIKMADAGYHQFIVPTSGQQMTFEAKVYREANYAGTLPQLIVRQDGQSAQTVTDVGAVSQWNVLKLQFTPATLPGYVAVEIRSDNTASSGSYGVYWGGLGVK